MMGGSLEVESDLGAGSIFRFTLELTSSGVAHPISQEPEQAAKYVLPQPKAERDPIGQSGLRDQLARLPLNTRKELRDGLQKLDLKGVALILASVESEHPSVAAEIEQLLRQHQYPMLCGLLDEVGA
jgi:hypothetical protein